MVGREGFPITVALVDLDMERPLTSVRCRNQSRLRQAVDALFHARGKWVTYSDGVQRPLVDEEAVRAPFTGEKNNRACKLGHRQFNRLFSEHSSSFRHRKVFCTSSYTEREEKTGCTWSQMRSMRCWEMLIRPGGPSLILLILVYISRKSRWTVQTFFWYQ